MEPRRGEVVEGNFLDFNVLLAPSSQATGTRRISSWFLQLALLASALMVALWAQGCAKKSPLGGGARELSAFQASRAIRSGALGPSRLRWSKNLAPEVAGPYTPVEHSSVELHPQSGRLYVGTTYGKFYAFDASGALAFEAVMDAGIEAQAAVSPDGQEVYIGTDSGMVSAFRTSDGKLLWKRRVPGAVRQRPAIQGDALYVITAEESVAALSRAKGELLWVYRRELPEGFSIAAHAGLALHDDRIFTGFTDGVVVALRASDGQMVWERDTRDDSESGSEESSQRVADVDTTPLVVGDSVYVASFAQGLYALDISNGSVEWRDARMTGVVGIEALGSDVVLASAEQGIVRYALDRREVVWARPLQRGSPSPPCVVRQGGWILIGESRGSLLSLDSRNGREIGRVTLKYGFSSQPKESEGMAAVLSNGGLLMVLSTDVKRPQSQPTPYREGWSH